MNYRVRVGPNICSQISELNLSRESLLAILGRLHFDLAADPDNFLQEAVFPYSDVFTFLVINSGYFFTFFIRRVDSEKKLEVLSLRVVGEIDE